MAVVTEVLEWLQSLPPAGVVAGAGLLVFGETTLGLGFIAPGETGLFVAGTTATSVPKFVIMWLVTSAAAVLGYSAGYLIGKHFGPKLRHTKIVQKHGAESWDKATDFLRRRGAFAVVLAIFLPVMRTLMPAAAGAAGLPFRKFLPAAALAGTSWCALHIGIGAAAGEAAKQIESYVGRGSWILLVLVVVVGGAVVLIKRRRAKVDVADSEREHEPQRETGSLS
ncbi:MAG: DedA family protein [Pseudonocardiaceae bacterium]